MSRGTKGPMFLSAKAQAVLVAIGVLLIMAGIGVLFLGTVPGVIVILIGAFVIYLAMHSGYAAHVGDYSAMKKHGSPASVYRRSSGHLQNPWDVIIGKSQPAAKKDCGQEHYSAANSPDRLSRLEAQYKAGLYSKKEYQQKKRELLRQK